MFTEKGGVNIFQCPNKSPELAAPIESNVDRCCMLSCSLSCLATARSRDSVADVVQEEGGAHFCSFLFFQEGAELTSASLLGLFINK